MQPQRTSCHFSIRAPFSSYLVHPKQQLRAKANDWLLIWPRPALRLAATLRSLSRIRGVGLAAT
jgi:hypothetical protein